MTDIETLSAMFAAVSVGGLIVLPAIVVAFAWLRSLLGETAFGMRMRARAAEKKNRAYLLRFALWMIGLATENGRDEQRFGPAYHCLERKLVARGYRVEIHGKEMIVRWDK